MGVIVSVIAFAAGCIASLKFWAGIALGCFVPAVKAQIVRGWSWLRGKI